MRDPTLLYTLTETKAVTTLVDVLSAFAAPASDLTATCVYYTTAVVWPEEES